MQSPVAGGFAKLQVHGPQRAVLLFQVVALQLLRPTHQTHSGKDLAPNSQTAQTAIQRGPRKKKT